MSHTLDAQADVPYSAIVVNQGLERNFVVIRPGSGEGQSLLVGPKLRYGVHSFGACLRLLKMNPASLSRRSTVPTPSRDTFNTWGARILREQIKCSTYFVYLSVFFPRSTTLARQSFSMSRSSFFFFFPGYG